MSFDPLHSTFNGPTDEAKLAEGKKVIFKRSRKQKSNKSELDWNHQNSIQEFGLCKYFIFAVFKKNLQPLNSWRRQNKGFICIESQSKRLSPSVTSWDKWDSCQTHELNSRFGTSKISCLSKAASNQSQRYRKNNEVPDDMNFFSASIWIQVFGNYRETWFGLFPFSAQHYEQHNYSFYLLRLCV